MTLPVALFLLAAGAGVGLFSGTLGLGGGILMFPILLYVPPLLGLPAFGVKEVTGLTMAQGFFASLSAMLFYRQRHFVHGRLALVLGSSFFASSLTGAYASRYVADDALLVVFALLASAAALMMLLPRTSRRDELHEDEVDFSRPLAIGLGLAVGFPIGLVGQGGAFIIIPLLLYVLKVPLRVALGSTLGIGLFSATAGLLGKVAAGQVPFLLALPLLAGAIPAARLGGAIGVRTRTPVLRWILALVVAAAAARVWLDIIR